MSNDVRVIIFFFFSSRRRHTIFDCDWSSDVCSSDLLPPSCCNCVTWRRSRVRSIDKPADNHARGRSHLNCRQAVTVCLRGERHLLKGAPGGSMTAISERATFDAAAFTRWCDTHLYTPAIRQGTRIVERACDLHLTDLYRQLGLGALLATPRTARELANRLVFEPSSHIPPDAMLQP